MADCGSSGTILDRAARSLLVGNGLNNVGSGVVDVNQVVSNLMGHATRSTSASSSTAVNSSGLALYAPKEIISLTPQSQFVNQSNQYSHSHEQQLVPPNQLRLMNSYNQHEHQLPMSRPYLPQQQQMSQPISYQQHHQMNQPNLMYQQQQQMMMMQQQQMMMFQQQQLQQQRALMHAAKQRQDQNLFNQQERQEIDSTVQYGEGFVQNVGINDLAKAWNDVAQSQDASSQMEQLDQNGHDGKVHNVDIHDLSSAWAEATAEYQNVFDQEEDFGNLWNYDNNMNIHENAEELPAYEFINQVNDSLQSEMSQENDVNHIEIGMREFQAGNIENAIREFEYEIQLNNPDSSIAWKMLGKCHAENDMDHEAIVCFENAVDRDPYCLESLLALGVSYVNELNHVKALENLKLWVTNNPKFAGLDIGEDAYGSNDQTPDSDENGFPNTSSFDEVQRLLLHALEYAESNTSTSVEHQATADILEALGVIYNVSRDYDAAIHSLQKAVALSPKNYQLYNKLGATLANSGNSGEALQQYYQAIQLKPKYARAWLNMAISHSNLSNYDEAIRCYLQTISLNRKAVHCWNYLRIALSCLEEEKWNLIPYATSQNLEAFQDHYSFIMYNSNA